MEVVVWIKDVVKQVQEADNIAEIISTEESDQEVKDVQIVMRKVDVSIAWKDNKWVVEEEESRLVREEQQKLAKEKEQLRLVKGEEQKLRLGRGKRGGAETG